MDCRVIQIYDSSFFISIKISNKSSRVRSLQLSWTLKKRRKPLKKTCGDKTGTSSRLPDSVGVCLSFSLGRSGLGKLELDGIQPNWQSRLYFLVIRLRDTIFFFFSFYHPFRGANLQKDNLTNNHQKRKPSFFKKNSYQPGAYIFFAHGSSFSPSLFSVSKKNFYFYLFFCRKAQNDPMSDRKREREREKILSSSREILRPACLSVCPPNRLAWFSMCLFPISLSSSSFWFF